jgi:solute carrier family 25 folate transporter 32
MSLSTENKHAKSSIPLIAGLLGGAASTFLLYPLDLVKVRLQVNEQSSFKTTASSTTSATIPKRTMIGTLRHVVKYEGLVGMYQGLTPALVGSAASWGGYFFFYEGIKQQMMQKNRALHRLGPHEPVQLDPMENFIAACVSGAIMVGCTNPLWLIKTRMQLQLKRSQEKQVQMLGEGRVKRPYRNILDAVRTIVREEGVGALYKGAVPALMLVSNGGVQFVTYEYLKGHFGAYTKASRAARKNNNDKSSSEVKGIMERFEDSLGYLTMGAVSKIISSTITYPIQVIKSRLQQRNETAEIMASGEVEIVKRHYNGVVDCIVKIWKNEGILGFFKGSIPNALRVAPSAAITFVVYEAVTDFLTTTTANQVIW